MKHNDKVRIYLPILEENQTILSREDSHYLINVLRMGQGDYVKIFDGKTGEYNCRILVANKKQTIIERLDRTKNFLPPQDFTLIFAIIKKTPLDFLVQKATEIGVGVFAPIITDNTVVRDINLERLEKVAIEAAQQCGLTSIPIFKEPISLSMALEIYDNIAFCDESMSAKNILLCDNLQLFNGVLIGPEGGFSVAERDMIIASKKYMPVTLGTRIMRAETAAIVASSIICLSKQ